MKNKQLEKRAKAVEKAFGDENISGKDLTKVIEGEEFGIIEDCGGTWGL